MSLTEKEKSIGRLKFEKEKLQRKKKELEDLFLTEGKIDKLMFDPEYQQIKDRINEIEKQMEINGQTDRMEQDIAEFRQRLKKEVERMLKEK